MNKNLVVLAMSTLPGNVKDTENIRPERFRWKPEDEEGQEYLCQLEPTSKMIREREGSLDRVVILATKATREKTLDDGKKSTVDFYLERMGINPSDADIINLEEHDFIPAISDTVEAIRKYWIDNNRNVKLWIDTQGAFRNINLVLNAVITLLEPDGIIPSGIYSLNYKRGNEIQSIEDQTETYKIFHFVSGINEFIRSGRAEQLTDYYQHTGKTVPEPIITMKEIAGAIQMCDMKEFDRKLQELRKQRDDKDKDKNEGLLGIFSNQIRRDYGRLLDDDCTGLDVVEWFYKKGFYQQAITYIEAKMPKEWAIASNQRGAKQYKGKGIISYRIDRNILHNLKNKLKKGYEADENIIISQIGVICFSEHSVPQNIKAYLNSNHISRALGQNIDLDNLDIKVREKQDKMVSIGNMAVTIHCNDRNEVMNLLLLYKLLKTERNNFNHMSQSNRRASREELGEAIRIFIETGRKVYENVC